MITTENKTISIKRTLDLPLNTAWKAWSDPESMKKWWGPNEYTCPHCTIDFRVNGKYLAAMRGPDGKDIWSTGMYKEIIPKKKIVCTDSFADSKGNVVPASDYSMPGDWGSELLVTVEFEEANGKTNLSLKHEGIPEEMYSDCNKGWLESLDKLEKTFK